MIRQLWQLSPKVHPVKRMFYVAMGLLALILIFVFQQFSYIGFFSETLFSFKLDPVWEFSLNKIIRFLLNDMAVITVIYGIFYEKKYVELSLLVVCFGFVFILLPYLFLVNNYPQYNGPLYSHLHRLVMNPILLLLLIPVLLYQKMMKT